MKIAMISEHASPLAALGGVDAGGQNVHVAALSTALAKTGHTVTVYTRRDSPELPERVAVMPGFEVVHIAAGPPSEISKDDLLPFMTEFGQQVANDWQADMPDVVHGHFWMSGIAALTAAGAVADQKRVPVLQTFHALGTVKRRHQGAQDTSPKEREWLEPWVGRSADGIVATCSDEVFELRAMGVPSRKAAIAPCGVDTDLFRPDGPTEERGDKKRFVVVGRLVPRKGVDIAIMALGDLAQAGRDDVELWIIGGAGSAHDVAQDPEVRRLSALAKELGVENQVTFRGQVPQERLAAIIRSGDGVICTPWYEPFGIVPLEAMACAVPVIAASVGGLIDTVVDGVTGIHIPPRDPSALAHAMLALMDDPERAVAFGNAGRDRALQNYSWEKVAALTVKAYHRVLSRSVPTGINVASGGAL